MSQFYKFDSTKTFYYFIDEKNQVYIRATGGSLGKWRILDKKQGFEKEYIVDSHDIPKDVKIKFIDAIFRAQLH